MSGEHDIYFLSKNYLNADDVVNVSSASLLIPRLYDQKYNIQWQSSGETGESGYNTYIEIIFYQGANTVDRTIDTFVLQNINLKDFKIQYYDDGTYVDIGAATFTANAEINLRIKLTSPITTAKIKIVMKATIAAGEEKKIGEFWALLETYCLSAVLSVRTRKDTKLAGLYRMGDGTGVQWRQWDRWGKTYQVKNLNDTQLAALEAIFKAHLLISFYENYTRDINSIRLVHWIGDFTGDDNPKIGIYLNTVTLEMVER